MRKKPRQYLSLLMAVVMVLSLSQGVVTASSAQENRDYIWYEENFDATEYKASVVSGSKQFADISAESAAVTDTGDNKAFKIIAQENSLTSGGYGGLFTDMLPIGQVSNVYSISYKIKFENYADATGNLARLITKDENGGAILDGAYYSKNSDGKVAISTGTLEDGWNTVEHIYDTVSKQETVFLNGTELETISQNSSGFKQFAVAPTNTVNIYVDDILVRDVNAFGTDGLKKNCIANEDIAFKVVLPYDCTSADIDVGGVRADSINTVDGQYVYSAVIERENLSQGTNTVRITAQCVSGTRTVEQTINVIANTPDVVSWSNDMSAYTESLATNDAVVSALGLSGVGLQGGATLSRSVGLGGRDGNVSLSFVNNSAAYTDKYSYFDKNISANEGKLSINFDLYNGSGSGSLNQYLLIQGSGPSAGYEIFSFEVTQNQWTNVSLELDLDSGTYSKTDNGGRATGATAFTSITNLRFRGSPYANNGRLVSYDNIEIFAYTLISGKLSGYSAGNVSVNADDAVSSKAESVAFDVNKTFSSVTGILTNSLGTEVGGISFETAGGKIKMNVGSPLAEGSYTAVLLPASKIGNKQIGVRVRIPFEVTGSTLIVPANALNISDGDIIYENPEYFTANVIAEKTVFYLDGEKLGEGANRITAPELTYGQHTLTAVCIAADGSARKTESKFTYAKKILIKSEEQTFDEIYDGRDSLINNTTLSTAKFELVQPDNANLYSVAGKSGTSGDGAVKFEIKTNELLTSSWPGLESKGFVGYDTGVSTIEFDIKLNSDKADEILITNPYLWWSDRYTLAYGGSWRGNTAVNKPVSTQWVHACLEIDADNKTVSFTVDDTVLADKVPYTQDAGNVYQNMSVRLSSKQNVARSEGEAHAGFTIDNFKAENIKVYTPARAEIVPEGLKITVSDGVYQNISKDDISLKTADGQDIEIDSIVRSSDGKEILVNAQLPADRTLEVRLSGNIKYLDGESFDRDNLILVKTPSQFIDTEVTFTANSKPLYCAEQLSGGETVTALISYDKVSSELQGAVYVLTARKNGRLMAISAETPDVSSAASGTVTLSLTLPSDADGCEVYLMVCDSLKGSKAIGNYIKIK